MLSNFICLLLQRYFKYQFYQMNRPILAEDHYTDVLFSFAKGIRGNWFNQFLWKNNSFFGADYGTETPHLILFRTYSFLDGNAHGGHFACEVSFDTISDIIYSVH